MRFTNIERTKIEVKCRLKSKLNSVSVRPLGNWVHIPSGGLLFLIHKRGRNKVEFLYIKWDIRENGNNKVQTKKKKKGKKVEERENLFIP